MLMHQIRVLNVNITYGILKVDKHDDKNTILFRRYGLSLTYFTISSIEAGCTTAYVSIDQICTAAVILTWVICTFIYI